MNGSGKASNFPIKCFAWTRRKFNPGKSGETFALATRKQSSKWSEWLEDFRMKPQQIEANKTKSSASESAKGCRTTKVDVNDASLIIYDLQVIEWTRWTVEADKFISDDVFMQSARLWKNLHIEPLNDSPLQSDSVVDVKWIVKIIRLSLLSSSFDILAMWSRVHFNAS